MNTNYEKYTMSVCLKASEGALTRLREAANTLRPIEGI